MKTYWIAAVVVATALIIGLKTRSHGGKPFLAAVSPAAAKDTEPNPSADLSIPASKLLAKPGVHAPEAGDPAAVSEDGPPVTESMSQILFQQLEGIMSLSDAMEDNPGLDDDALIQIAIERSGLPRETLKGLLAEYPTSSSRSLAEHYRRALANPDLRAVAGAFQRVGITHALESNLLADGFRLCSLRTLHGDHLAMMSEDLRWTPEGVDPIPQMLTEAARLEEERSRSLTAIEAAFQDRFMRRHGIDPSTVQALLEALRPVRVATASAEQLHPPRIVSR